MLFRSPGAVVADDDLGFDAGGAGGRADFFFLAVGAGSDEVRFFLAVICLSTGDG